MSVRLEAVKRQFPIKGLEKKGALTWFGMNLTNLAKLRIKLSPVAYVSLTRANGMDPVFREVLSTADLGICLSAESAVRVLNRAILKRGSDGPASTPRPAPWFSLRKLDNPTFRFQYELSCKRLPNLLI